MSADPLLAPKSFQPLARVDWPHGPLFVVRVMRGDGWCRLALEGELDLATAPCLHLELKRAEQRGALLLLVDLRGLSFMDLTGMRVLIAAQERARDIGVELAALDPPPAVRRLLTLAGVDKLLNVTHDPAPTHPSFYGIWKRV